MLASKFSIGSFSSLKIFVIEGAIVIFIARVTLSNYQYICSIIPAKALCSK